jgi:hypothetical protein
MSPEATGDITARNSLVGREDSRSCRSRLHGPKASTSILAQQRHVAVLVTFDDDTTGKLGFYLAAVNRTMRTTIEGPSIGVLLCESLSGPMVEFALDNTNQPIGVSTCQVTRELPPPMFTAASLKGPRYDKKLSDIVISINYVYNSEYIRVDYASRRRCVRKSTVLFAKNVWWREFALICQRSGCGIRKAKEND